MQSSMGPDLKSFTNLSMSSNDLSFGFRDAKVFPIKVYVFG